MARRGEDGWGEDGKDLGNVAAAIGGEDGDDWRNGGGGGKAKDPRDVDIALSLLGHDHDTGLAKRSICAGHGALATSDSLE